jgi:uncharacterized delta-60 repeat protein
VNTIALQPDGKILIGGDFTSFDGNAVNHIIRLNSDGSFDSEFTVLNGGGFDGNVNTIALQPDGKILIGGSFDNFDSTIVNYIIRLNSDGSFDQDFTTNNGV